MTNSFDREIIKSTVGDNPVRANIVRDQKPVTPEPPDEVDDTEPQRTIKFHMQSQSWTIMEDGVLTSPNGTDFNIAGKDVQSQVILRNNGDIIISAGGQGGGKICGGRVLINARGGQLVKSGPSVEEYVSDSGSVQGEGPKNDKEELARSVVCYGDFTEEVLGDRYIRGKTITIDAQDVLTLIAKEKLVIQAGPEGGGEIVFNAGKVTTKTDIEDKVVTGQSLTISSESTDVQFDPRASKNIISPGHINHKVLGDYKLDVAGVGRLSFLGSTLSVPLVKDLRTNALNIHCVAGNIGMMTDIGSMFIQAGMGPKWPSLTDILPGAVTMTAKSNIQQEALVNYSAKATAGKMDLEALGVATLNATGGVTIDAEGAVDIKSKGITTITGTFIKLN